MDRRKALQTIGLSTLAAPFLVSCARDEEDRVATENSEQPEDDGMADFLFVQEAEGVRFEGDRMILLNVSPKTLFFTDRPQELAGYLSHEEFMNMVAEGPDNFEEDPPNATMVTHDGEGFRNVVVSSTSRRSSSGAVHRHGGKTSEPRFRGRSASQDEASPSRQGKSSLTHRGIPCPPSSRSSI